MKVGIDGKLHHVVPLIMVVMAIAVGFDPFELADICMLESSLSLIFH